MRFRVGIEELEPMHWIAWVFDLPACYARGESEYEALSLVSQRIQEHYDWLTLNGIESQAPRLIEPDVIEVHYVHESKEEPGYMVNAFFMDDRRPVKGEEVDLVRELLGFTAGDLHKVLVHVSDEERLKERPGEANGSIDGILRHLAGAEWWYWDRLEMAHPMEQMPEDTITRLLWVREMTHENLNLVAGKRKIFSWSGEQWSARKVIRRTLWHERDHTEHIAHLIHL